jgi:hypothetical protein
MAVRLPMRSEKTLCAAGGVNGRTGLALPFRLSVVGVCAPPQDAVGTRSSMTSRRSTRASSGRRMKARPGL